MAKKYIFIDTNIYTYCASMMDTKPHNNEIIEKFISVLEDNPEVVLLVPEIVKLEYEKTSKTAITKKERDIETLKEYFQKEGAWLSNSEKSRIISLLVSIVDDTKKNCIAVNRNLQRMFELQNTKLIKVNSEILTRWYLRAIAWKKPFCNKTDHIINADCIIIESIIDYLEKQKSKKSDLLVFCTNNKGDFADPLSINTKTLSLAKDIEQDLKITTKYYGDLPELIKLEFKKKISTKGIQNYEEAVNTYSIWINESTINSAFSLARESIVSWNKINESIKPSIHDALSLLTKQATVGETLFRDMNRAAEASKLLITSSMSTLNQINPYLASYNAILTCIRCGKSFVNSGNIYWDDRCPECRNSGLSAGLLTQQK